MHLMEILKNRRSVRRYIEKTVEHEQILYVLEAARLAPSWRNQQCWKFIVVTDLEIKKQIIQCTSSYNRNWLGKEPAIIVACGNPEKSGFRNNQHYYLVDVAIAVEHLMLAATELGLGTCWLGAFDAEKIKQILHIPEKIQVVTLTPLGYPDESEGFIAKITQKVIQSKTRKSIEEIVYYNRWE